MLKIFQQLPLLVDLCVMNQKTCHKTVGMTFAWQPSSCKNRNRLSYKLIFSYYLFGFWAVVAIRAIKTLYLVLGLYVFTKIV